MTVAAAVMAASGCAGPKGAPTTHRAPDPVASAQPAVRLRYMTPVGIPMRKQRAWKEIAAPARVARLDAMADNEAAQFALAVYAIAWDLAPPAWPQTPTLFIGLEPGGNFARQGLVLTDADGVRHELPDLPYLILSEDAERFRDTLLHESAHVMHGLLIGDQRTGTDADAFAPIPHSTAAITDRRTAFNEGFAIHFETVNAHCGRDPKTRAFYDHAALAHGDAPVLDAEYYFGVRDLRNYAQTFARYQRVRDGDYAFEPATNARDYLAVQLDPARDRRRLRPGSAMVASEGFVASVLFHVVARDGCDSLAELVPRYRSLLAAVKVAETTTGPLDATPLLDVVAAAGPPAIAALLDLSRGATIDPDAAALWIRLYDAALALELETFDAIRTEANARRARWRTEATANPTALARAVGPVAVVAVPDVRTGLRLFGQPQPLVFDANAAGPAMLGLVPGITDAAIEAMLASRANAPFRDSADAVRRAEEAGVPAGALAVPDAGR